MTQRRDALEPSSGGHVADYVPTTQPTPGQAADLASALVQDERRPCAADHGPEAGGAARVSNLPTPFVVTLLAPMLGLWRPDGAAERLLHARTAAVLATTAVWCLFPAIIATLAAIIGPSWPDGVAELVQLLRGQWHAAHATGLFGWIEVMLVSWIAVALLLVLWQAWIELPRVHDGGDVSQSFFRAIRIAVSILGWLSLGTVVACTALVRAVSVAYVSELPMGLAILLCAGVATICLSRAAHVFATLADRRPPASLPPRCEDCGYDLTHTPAEARCSECGLSVTASLSAVRRPGVAWESSEPLAVRWTRTLVECLTTPTRFYSQLRCQSPARLPRSFAASNVVLLPVLALIWVWATVFLIIPGPRPTIEVETFAFMLAFVAIGGLLVWVGYRTGGAFVATIWLLRGALPDARWAERIICYESAFVWVYCVFWGSLATSFMIKDEWLTGAIGEQRAYAMFGMSAEEAVFWAGTALLSFVWLWRYAVAARHVLWANH